MEIFAHTGKPLKDFIYESNKRKQHSLLRRKKRQSPADKINIYRNETYVIMRITQWERGCAAW